MKHFSLLLFVFFRCQLFSCGQILEFEEDKDIQEALIALSSRLSRHCPIVLIYDEQMPEFSVAYTLIKRMHEHGRQFILLELSADKLLTLEKRYGTQNPSEIIPSFLYTLYRQQRCYTFVVWVTDPRILYPETETNVMYHPGWRGSDNVILVTKHITKRYKALINLRFWTLIPNIVGLKRNNYDEYGLVKVFTVLPYFRNGKRKSQEIDTWDALKKEFVRNSSRFFFDKFRNFHNAPIVVGVLWKEPFFIWGNKENPYLDGLDWRLFLLCQNLLNFTLSFRNVNTTGHMLSNNSWSGMMGHLASGLIDVAVGGISVTSDRLKYFDFCRTYYVDSFNFIAPLNNQVDSAISAIFRPLSYDVWIAAILSALLGIIALKVITSIEHGLSRRSCTTYTVKEFRDNHFSSLGNICGFIVTVFCQKPYRHLPNALPVQFVYYGFSLTIFGLGMVFSSCLISFILSFKPEPIANKVDDILKTNLPIAIKNYDGHLNAYMMGSGNPVLAKIYEKAVLVDYYQSFDAMDDVVKGKKIYVDSKAKIRFTGRYKYSGSKGLKFHISSENIIEFANLGWPVQKNWPFREPFDKIISRAVESGLIQHWVEYFMQGKFGGDEAWKIPSSYKFLEKQIGVEELDPSMERAEGFVPLSTSHVGGIFTLFVVGISLAMFVFIVECTTGLIHKIYELVLRCYKNCKPDALVKLQQKNSLKLSKQASHTQCGNVGRFTQNVVKKVKFLKLNKDNLIKPKLKLHVYPQLVWNDFGIRQDICIRKDGMQKLSIKLNKV